VLERDEALSKTIKRHLGVRAHVVVVHDDYGALFAIGRTRPAVIVIDLDTPNLDARRLVLAVRNEATFADVDIVALAGSTTAKLARGWGDESLGNGLLYVYRRAEKDAILASISSILDRARHPRRSA